MAAVQALQTQRAQLLEGLAAHPGQVSGCRFERRVSPWACEGGGERDAGVLVIAGLQLQQRRCSGARCSRATSGRSPQRNIACSVPCTAGCSARLGCPLWEADFVPEGSSSERVYKVSLCNA